MLSSDNSCFYTPDLAGRIMVWRRKVRVKGQGSKSQARECCKTM